MRPALLLLLALPALGADRATDRAEALRLGALTAPPAVHDAAGFKTEDGIRPIFFDALPWQGRPTRVFAYLGLPAQRAGKAPAIVLVHGGGGTAFREWVKKWNDEGFAAISIAVEGQTDLNTQKEPKRPPVWGRHEWSGPARTGTFVDGNLPLKDQWMYHALADTILANSLLRSLPEVDAGKIGVMGISWGGVITSTVVGIDARFAFGIPTYGCGHLFDAENNWGVALHDNETYIQVWDGMNYADRVRMPVLWLSWPQDAHFPLGCQAEHYRRAPGPRLVSLVSKMGHSHPAGWNPPDSYAFARSIVETGNPWASCLSVGAKDGVAVAAFASTKPLDAAVLVSTVDRGFTGKRQWVETPATAVSGGGGTTVSAPLPPGTTAWYLNVRSGKLTVSSDYQEVR